MNRSFSQNVHMPMSEKDKGAISEHRSALMLSYTGFQEGASA